jgi:hypothetical protein
VNGYPSTLSSNTYKIALFLFSQNLEENLVNKVKKTTRRGEKASGDGGWSRVSKKLRNDPAMVRLNIEAERLSNGLTNEGMEKDKQAVALLGLAFKKVLAKKTVCVGDHDSQSMLNYLQRLYHEHAHRTKSRHPKRKRQQNYRRKPKELESLSAGLLRAMGRNAKSFRKIPVQIGNMLTRGRAISGIRRINCRIPKAVKPTLTRLLLA